jgi:hypothetical protein
MRDWMKPYLGRLRAGSDGPVQVKNLEVANWRLATPFDSRQLVRLPLPFQSQAILLNPVV